jgi:hypothetical protein
MIVKGYEKQGFGNKTQPERRQVMKIARAVEEEWRRQIARPLTTELFDQAWRRGETQLRSPA